MRLTSRHVSDKEIAKKLKLSQKSSKCKRLFEAEIIAFNFTRRKVFFDFFSYTRLVRLCKYKA